MSCSTFLLLFYSIFLCRQKSKYTVIHNFALLYFTLHIVYRWYTYKVNHNYCISLSLFLVFFCTYIFTLACRYIYLCKSGQYFLFTRKINSNGGMRLTTRFIKERKKLGKGDTRQGGVRHCEKLNIIFKEKIIVNLKLSNTGILIFLKCLQ